MAGGTESSPNQAGGALCPSEMDKQSAVGFVRGTLGLDVTPMEVPYRLWVFPIKAESDLIDLLNILWSYRLSQR